ncbi:receptor-like protein kinase FERONIA [Gossypium arboreum]|uniref:Protein kinase domain-containing protein n=1 Tax=Gossypium arboreum TaxID=29729 RepID=A0ABR0N3C9_GOSAR|nr:receptor-like protein kinase FERONIA [Gossypium arboreum]KAK5784380.1 hypothetical protein PVK06_038903 [Gossypium arboreum]
MKNPLCSCLGLFILNKTSPQLNRGSELPEGLCRHFSLAEIKAATNNFHPNSVIGESCFWSVHKGAIDYGTIVGVKRCRNGSCQDAVREVQNEVRFLCQLRHPLLVSLIGICEERNEIILAYEYVSRGTLADHLYGQGYAPLLWKRRLQICISAARGLHYLHTGAKYALFHGHITSRSILVNEELSCKLHDFRFSRLGSFSMSKASRVRKESRISGTFGYMAPEYAMYGELTEKSDVFSFGIILYEVLLGRTAYDSTLPKHKQHILNWLKDSQREGTINNSIDPYLKGRIAPECLEKYSDIASSCAHYKGNERPAMGEVVVTLELALELQERADSKMEAINPSGEFMYEELFSASVSKPFASVSEFCYPYDDYGNNS